MPRTVVANVNIAFTVADDYEIDGDEYLSISDAGRKGISLVRNGNAVSESIAEFTTIEVFAEFTTTEVFEIEV